MTINSIVKRINNMNYFLEVYTIIIFLLGLFGWLFSFEIFSSIIIIFGIVFLFLTKDFKYIIPVILAVLFSYSTGFNINMIPISLGVLGVVLILLCLWYSIKSIRRLHFDKYLVCYLLLAVICLIPILWNHNVPKGNEFLYLINLTWLLYLFVYIILKVNIKKNSFKDIIMILSYLGILISLEVIISYFQYFYNNPNADDSYVIMLGWGIVNEAGIMLCFVMPFFFIRIINFTSKKNIIFELIKLAIICFGIIFTTSRGTYLFGAMEFVLLSIGALIYSKNVKFIRYIFVICFSLLVIFVLTFIGIDRILSIINVTFTNGFSGTGRFELWEMGIAKYETNIYTRLFGSGMLAEFFDGFSKPSETGFDLVYVVYHSTIIESLVAFGLVGTIVLFILIFFKYDDLKYLSKQNMYAMFVGFFIVDAYGLIDNTYGMYYYMIPLIILMISLESSPDLDYNLLF